MLIVILLLNMLILRELKAFTKRRILLTGATSHTATTLASVAPVSESVLIGQRAEKRRCRLILFTGLMYVLGHAVQAISNFQSSFFYNESYDAWFCVYFVASTLLNLSYAVNFFLYYFFNTQFKKYANETIALLSFPVRGFLGKSQATN
jgi:hypothetical protein